MRRMPALHPSASPLALLALAATLAACPSNENFDSAPEGDTTTSGAAGTTGGTTGEPTTSSAGTTTTESTTDGSSSGTTGEPAGLCPDHTTTDACCCFEAFMNLSSTVNTVCDTQSLCAPAEFECSDINQTCAPVDEKVVNCVLAALADGTMIGSVSIRYDIDNGYGQRKIDVYFQGDKTAYVADKDELDLSGYFKPTGRHTLQDASYFQTCLDSGDAQAKADCLKTVVVGPASEVCIDEFNYET